tara:strand:- start:165 stop:407 length:243 start_codon:yes stop_codon:yes gene_type:complete
MQEEIVKEIEFTLIDDEDMPPIVISMDGNDNPKVVINRHHTIWLGLHRNLITGCSMSLHSKMNELLTAYLAEQRMFERMS